MKKLIAISVVFALVAGAAFAEASVSGTVFGTVTPLQGDTGKDAAGDAHKITAGGGYGRIRVEASGQDDDGVFGGYIRLEHGAWWGSGAPVVSADANVWWKPVDAFKFTIGNNGHDGFFGADGVARWNFYQVPGDVGFIAEHWWYSSSFYGGFDAGGGILTITPIDALEINLGIPFIGMAGREALDVFLSTNVQVAYTIDGIGKLAVTYDGGTGYKAEVKPKAIFVPAGDPAEAEYGWVIKGASNPPTASDFVYVAWEETKPAATTGAAAKWKLFGGSSASDDDPMKFYAYFGLTAIENLGIDFGIGYTLPIAGEGYTINTPVAIGLGVNFSAGDFGIKGRFQGEFAGSLATSAKTYADAITIIGDVLPSYAISEKLLILMSAGLRVDIPPEGDNVIGWHIQPYVAVKSNWWSPNFWAGVRIDSNGEKQGTDPAIINWSVPVGMGISF